MNLDAGGRNPCRVIDGINGMFYQPAEGHGLPHDPLKAIIAPRPIGWISSLDVQGRHNLAPYSFFNQIGGRPPIVAFSSEGRKDSVANIEASEEFVVNLATRPLAGAMNRSSAAVASGVDEFALAGLTALPCRLVAAARVGESPVNLECRLTDLIPLKDLDRRPTGAFLAIGQVVGVHIDDRLITANGRFDTVAARIIARCGYADYTEVVSLFEMNRPSAPAGLER